LELKSFQKVVYQEDGSSQLQKEENQSLREIIDKNSHSSKILFYLFNPKTITTGRSP